MRGDYGYGPSIGFLRFCDDPELACCRAEKDYLRLKAQEIDLYEKAMELECELTKLRKVVEAAREFISSTGCNPKECGKCDPKYIGFCRWSGIGQALAELDEADHD